MPMIGFEKARVSGALGHLQLQTFKHINTSGQNAAHTAHAGLVQAY
jgi:hypothetical protein